MQKWMVPVIVTVAILIALASFVYMLQPTQKTSVVVQSVPYPGASHIWAPVGEPVYIYVTVKAVGSDAVGTLKIEVRKDLIDSPDQLFTIQSTHVSFNQGTEFSYRFRFTPTDLTCTGMCGPGSFNSYFVKVYFNDVLIYDNKDRENREWVKTFSTPTPTPTPTPTSTPGTSRCGDVNGDGIVTDTDRTCLNSWISSCYNLVPDCKPHDLVGSGCSATSWSSDVNCDGKLDGNDALALYFFLNGGGSINCCAR